MDQDSFLTNLDRPQISAPVVIALGNFDGIHKGHQVLLQRAQDMAQKHGKGCRPLVISFDPHPVAILKPPHYPLMSLEQKKDRFKELKIDDLWIIPFTPHLAQLSAEIFIEQILLKNLNIQGVVVGFNFRFGHDRLGDTNLLRNKLIPLGIQVEVIDPIRQTDSDQQIISTTRIKQALREGQIELVTQWLGTEYKLRGLVARGQGRGHLFGIPTLNFDQVQTLLPKEGVYWTQMHKISEPFTIYQAVTNLGPQPTFDQQMVRVETHVLDFNQMIYDQQVEISFLSWIRPVMRFTTVQELLGQIHQDIQFVRQQIKRE